MRSRREYELDELRSSQYPLTERDLPTKTYDSGYDDYTRAASPGTKIDPESLQPVPAARFAPNRRRSNGDIARGTVDIEGLTENNLAKHDALMGKNPYVHNFTSPIREFLCFPSFLITGTKASSCFVLASELMDGS